MELNGAEVEFEIILLMKYMLEIYYKEKVKTLELMER